MNSGEEWIEMSEIPNSDHSHQLYKAAEGGDINEVGTLLFLSEIDVNYMTQEKRSPLYIACSKGHSNIVKMLLSDPRTDPNSWGGFTPLNVACKQSHLEIMTMLLKHPMIDVNKYLGGYGNQTSLHMAAFVGNTQIFKLLVSHPQIRLDFKTVEGYTALQYACDKGHTEIVKLILSHPSKCPVDRADIRGISPLYTAGNRGHTEIVQMLLETHRGVDVNRKRFITGSTALFMACQNNHVETVKLLLARKDIDVNLKKNDGATPFHIACERGNIEIINILMDDTRVDINTCRDDGVSGFWMASQNNRLQVVKRILADKTKTVNRTFVWNGNNNNAYQTAIFMNNTKVVELLGNFERNPTDVKLALQNELKLDRDLIAIANVFALVVLFSDGYLKPKKKTLLSFWNIAVSLPMELQMVLANRVFGSKEDLVLSAYSGPAFVRMLK